MRFARTVEADPRDCVPSSRQLAIEVDGIIVSAPTLNVPVFEGSVLISGEFTEQEARELADVLIAGALDVEWVVES